METLIAPKTDWNKLTHHLGRQFVKSAPKTDRLGSFVKKNYEELKAHQYFSAMIPEDLGGGGISHKEMCEIIKIIGRYCGSTALALAMHQHLVGTTIWKYITKGQGEATLRKVAREQTILVSTGARDWLQSNGTMTAVEGGYLLSARKRFASQSAIGDIAISSAPFQNNDGIWEVLHFPVPLSEPGVSLLDDWNTLGMRGTGSQTIAFDNVFIPEEKIALRRPQEGFHMVWNVVLTVAMPLIMSAYVGIAERAFELALEQAKSRKGSAAHMPLLIGQMKNNLVAAQAQLSTMMDLTNDFQFKPAVDTTIDILSYKTNIAELTMKIVDQGMDAIGGQSFYKKNEMERLFRDVQAAKFHPLPKWNQYLFTGQRLIDKHVEDHQKNLS